MALARPTRSWLPEHITARPCAGRRGSNTCATTTRPQQNPKRLTTLNAEDAYTPGSTPPAGAAMSNPMPDINDMSPDELFATLGLEDMDDCERLEFIRYVRAWARAAIPGPNRLWLHMLVQAELWRRHMAERVDHLITQAIGQ